MKKLFTLIFLAGSTLIGNAQISSGFYHIQNDLTTRYMIMVDNTKGSTSASHNDLGSVETSKNWEKVSTHPGAICYITPKGGSEYDVYAQGTSIGALTQGKVYPRIDAQGDGTYTIWGSGVYQGVTVTIYMGDKSNVDTKYKEKDDSELGEADSKNRYWKLHKIDNTNHYLGLKPDFKTSDGAFWGSIYVGFACELSDGMEAYYVDKLTNSEYHLTKITAKTIAPETPMLIKCTSDDPAKNIIRPVAMTGGTEITGNKLSSLYFDCGKNYHNTRRVAFNKSTMRVPGLTSDGKLAFVSEPASDYLTDGAYLPHNKVYFGSLTSSAAATIVEEGTSGINQIATEEIQSVKKGLYSLTGQQIPEGITPRPGIYIKDGKKIIIK